MLLDAARFREDLKLYVVAIIHNVLQMAAELRIR
ncbi:unnamed protein product [Trichobilharzia regenti]|nr:unnamed protein product [Trichobilharzia regenti]